MHGLAGPARMLPRITGKGLAAKKLELRREKSYGTHHA
jgi:hypothetical protein